MTSRPRRSFYTLLWGLACLGSLGAACPQRPATVPASAASPVQKSAPAGTVTRTDRFAAAAPGKRAAIIFTASVQGYVTPCGCTADPLGGIARLSAAVDEARAAYGERVFFLDAGDLLFEKADDVLDADRCQAEARVDLLLSTYARIGLRATVRGPLDDVRGAEFRDARLAALEIPTLGVPDSGRALVHDARFRRSMVLEADGVRVGVTGFSADGAGDVQRTRAALSEEIDTLWSQGVDAVVALAQAPRTVTRAIVGDLVGLDVVIQGRAPGELPVAPERIGARGPLLVAAGMQAQHVGVLELELDERVAKAWLPLDDREAAMARRLRLLEKRISQYETQVSEAPDPNRRAFLQQKLVQAQRERDALPGESARMPPPSGPHVRFRALALTRGSAEEETAREALARYEANIPELVSACEANVQCPEVKPGEASYVGVKTCQACHADAVAFWRTQTVTTAGKDHDGREIARTSGHARAWLTLEAEHKTKDRSCIGCHSVGFNAPGGYCKTQDVEGFEGVQCESCHGPGSLHVANPIDKTTIQRVVPETTCRGCHQVPHIPTTESFVYLDKLRFVLGPGHGGARLLNPP